MEAALETPAPQEGEIYVWPDMVDAVALFFSLETQWRWVGAGMAGAFRTGLDYSVLPGMAAALEIKVTAEALADLKTMECAAVEQWSRK